MTKRKKKVGKNLTKSSTWDTKYTQKASGGTGGTITNTTTSGLPAGAILQTSASSQTTYVATKCHTGNTAIYKEPNGGTLFIGGWNNGATFDWNTHVIDLTGMEHKYYDIPIAYDEDSKAFLPFLMKAYAGWLSLPFPDYGTPKGLTTKEQWTGVKDTIQGILRKGHDVLVACHGGHGRSGLFCSIVGYMLNIQNDPTWASPVEKIREIHCDDAVETYAQEKFVYSVLGLRIQPKHVYDNDPWYYSSRGGSLSAGTSTNYYPAVQASSFKQCDICGTESLYVDDLGMCLTCSKGYADKAPVRTDLSLEDIEHKGLVDHWCTDDKCMGIWKASVCGHVVHNQIIYDGYCETCYRRMEDEQMYAEQKLTEKIQEPEEPYAFQIECALCGKNSVSSQKFGVCFECSSKLVTEKLITDVHNTITDPYKFIPHTHCEDEHMCVGIVRADVCQHVTHNREIDEGLCPACYELRHGGK